ncbi:MAG: hypothetical protein MI747_03350, partial [Desulfobacterales bacterium]|nr:hypothetical protein [Desulfobacterales bacterium]
MSKITEVPSDQNDSYELPPLPDNWPGMTGDEKQKYLTQDWASIENKSFQSDDIAEKYQKKARRWLDVVALKQPDKVPNLPFMGECILNFAGVKSSSQFYDPDAAVQAAIKFHENFDCDFSVLDTYPSGKAADLLGMNYFRLPGSTLDAGLPEDSSMQYVEDEYMRADEYDEFIGNPEGYLIRKYMPRIFSQTQGLSDMPSFLESTQLFNASIAMASFSHGKLRNALETLLAASDEAGAHFGTYLSGIGELTRRFGVLAPYGGCVSVPYDILGDSLRGTKQIMMDLY